MIKIQTPRFVRLAMFTFLLMPPLSISCQNFARIDSLAMNAPPLAKKSPLDLAAYCQANAHSDLEMVRFYFVWVARNTQYDERAAKIPNLEFDQRKQSPQSVFKTHKAICTGYSRLMEHLCRLSNIPVLYVAGYGKGNLNPDGIQPHAWNVIKVGGEWSLIDATWASNALAADSSNLSVEFERYFMGLPDFFQKGHLPYDPVFQLTTETINRQEFFPLTEGGDSEKPEEDFNTILNNEYTLDSIDFTIKSHRRGLAFMPNDSNIVVKLRGGLKEKSYWVLKGVQDQLSDFSKNADKNLEKLSIYKLREWSQNLEHQAEPLQTAIEINKEIENLETKEEKIEESRQKRQQIFDLIGYFSQSLKAVKEEIGKRQ